MPQITLNLACSRCPRVEQTELTLEKAVQLAQDKDKAKGPPALKIEIDGEVVAVYEHLCSVCRSTVGTYVDSATRHTTKKSSKRVVKPKDMAKEKVAVPSVPPKPSPSAASLTGAVRPAGSQTKR